MEDLNAHFVLIRFFLLHGLLEDHLVEVMGHLLEFVHEAGDLLVSEDDVLVLRVDLVRLERALCLKLAEFDLQLDEFFEQVFVLCLDFEVPFFKVLSFD